MDPSRSRHAAWRSAPTTTGATRSPSDKIGLITAHGGGVVVRNTSIERDLTTVDPSLHVRGDPARVSPATTRARPSGSSRAPARSCTRSNRTCCRCARRRTVSAASSSRASRAPRSTAAATRVLDGRVASRVCAIWDRCERRRAACGVESRDVYRGVGAHRRRPRPGPPRRGPTALSRARLDRGRRRRAAVAARRHRALPARGRDRPHRHARPARRHRPRGADRDHRLPARRHARRGRRTPRRQRRNRPAAHRGARCVGRDRHRRSPATLRQQTIDAWNAAGRNLAATARALGIDPRTVRDRLIRHGIPERSIGRAHAADAASCANSCSARLPAPPSPPHRRASPPVRRTLAPTARPARGAASASPRRPRPGARAYAEHGSVRAAARALGISPGSFQYRLRRAQARTRPGREPTAGALASAVQSPSLARKGCSQIVRDLRMRRVDPAESVRRSALPFTPTPFAKRHTTFRTRLGSQSHRRPPPSWSPLTRLPIIEIGVQDPAFTLDLMARECPPLQFLREYTKNGIEAIEAYRQHVDPAYQGKVIWTVAPTRRPRAEPKAPKLCCIDTGIGMTSARAAGLRQRPHRVGQDPFAARQLRCRREGFGRRLQPRRRPVLHLA